MPPGAVSQLTSTWDTRGWVSQMHALYTTSASACTGTVHVHGSSMSSVGSPRPILLHTTVQSQSLALSAQLVTVRLPARWCLLIGCMLVMGLTWPKHSCPFMMPRVLPAPRALRPALGVLACVHQRRRAFACHNLRTELAVIGAGVAQHTV